MWSPLGLRVLVYEVKVLTGPDLQAPPSLAPTDGLKNLILSFCSSMAYFVTLGPEFSKKIWCLIFQWGKGGGLLGFFVGSRVRGRNKAQGEK